MANVNGNAYGLTCLFPILNQPAAQPAPVDRLRAALREIGEGGPDSPFAKVPMTHFCRLTVIDDTVYSNLRFGPPDGLKNKYLMFTSNFDGSLPAYAETMRQAIPDVIERIWSNCWGYPDIGNPALWLSYIEACQIETTFFFADVNNTSVSEILRALEAHRRFLAFYKGSRHTDPAELREKFIAFAQGVRDMPTPARGWE